MRRSSKASTCITVCFLGFTIWIAGCCGGEPARTSGTTDGDTMRPLHVYILAGQSNMAGRGAIGSVDTTEHPRVFALKADMSWGAAREPLHFDKPHLVGVGPGLTFGKALANRDTSVLIGLVPAAVGGSAIKEWRPGRRHRNLDIRPYDDAISRASRVLAMQEGELRGIIWHQGESDRDRPAEAYLAELVELVQRFREEFDRPDLPFIAGELGYFYAAREPGAASINAILKELPGHAPATAVVSADGLTHKGDSIHFDAVSARELGKRYAEAMIALR